MTETYVRFLSPVGDIRPFPFFCSRGDLRGLFLYRGSYGTKIELLWVKPEVYYVNRPKLSDSHTSKFYIILVLKIVKEK